MVVKGAHVLGYVGYAWWTGHVRPLSSDSEEPWLLHGSQCNRQYEGSSTSSLLPPVTDTDANKEKTRLAGFKSSTLPLMRRCFLNMTHVYYI